MNERVSLWYFFWCWVKHVILACWWPLSTNPLSKISCFVLHHFCFACIFLFYMLWASLTVMQVNPRSCSPPIRGLRLNQIRVVFLCIFLSSFPLCHLYSGDLVRRGGDRHVCVWTVTFHRPSNVLKSKCSLFSKCHFHALWENPFL